eukprot:EG_transcript_10971
MPASDSASHSRPRSARSSSSDSSRDGGRTEAARGTVHTANLHHYKPTTERLELVKSEKHRVLLEEKPFASGGVCQAFRIWFLSADGEKGPLQVAKKYIFKEGTKGFREDHVNWYVTSLCVDPFNELLASRCPTCPRVQLVSITRLLEIRGQWYSLEEYIEGRFRKFNNIFGDVERCPLPGEDSTYFDLAAAFSHFTYCHSGGEYAVLDVQGVDATYTDCAVVSRQHQQFGYTDTGLPGLQNFLAQHTCNAICAKLALKSPLHGAAVRADSKSGSRVRKSSGFTPVKPPPLLAEPHHEVVLQSYPAASRLTPTLLLGSGISPTTSPVPWETTSPVMWANVFTPYGYYSY